MDIYKYLHLDKLDCCVAIIKNAKSSKMGKKDIIGISKNKYMIQSLFDRSDASWVFAADNVGNLLREMQK